MIYEWICLEAETTVRWRIDIYLGFSFKEFSFTIFVSSTLPFSVESLETMLSSGNRWLSLKGSVHSIERIALLRSNLSPLSRHSIWVSDSSETCSINSMEVWFFENRFLLNPNALMRNPRNLAAWSMGDCHKEVDRTQHPVHTHQISLLECVWTFRVHCIKDYLRIRPYQCLFGLISQNLQF